MAKKEVQVNFKASAAEVRAWKRLAALEQRPLSQWIRHVLSKEKQTIETIEQARGEEK